MKIASFYPALLTVLFVCGAWRGNTLVNLQYTKAMSLIITYIFNRRDIALPRTNRDSAIYSVAICNQSISNQ